MGRPAHLARGAGLASSIPQPRAGCWKGRKSRVFRSWRRSCRVELCLMGCLYSRERRWARMRASAASIASSSTAIAGLIGRLFWPMVDEERPRSQSRSTSRASSIRSSSCSDGTRSPRSMRERYAAEAPMWLREVLLRERAASSSKPLPEPGRAVDVSSRRCVSDRADGASANRRLPPSGQKPQRTIRLAARAYRLPVIDIASEAGGHSGLRQDQARKPPTLVLLLSFDLLAGPERIQADPLRGVAIDTVKEIGELNAAISDEAPRLETVLSDFLYWPLRKRGTLRRS
jgi:hypothetical protein